MEIRVQVDEQLKEALDALSAANGGASAEVLIRASVLEQARLVTVPELSRQLKEEWSELYDRLAKDD